MPEVEKVDDISSVVVSSKVLSDIIGVSDRRIRGLAEEGILTKTSSGRYKLRDSIHDYILNLKVINNAKEQVQYDGELNYEEEKALHERVKRQTAELNLARMRGLVHNAEDVEAVMIDMLANFKAKLSSMPSKLTPLLVAREEKGYILDLLTREVREILMELSGYNAKDFYGKEYIELEEDE